MSQLDLSELAATIVATTQTTECSTRYLSDVVAELFGRLAEGLPDATRGLLAGMINRRLGIQVL